MTKQTRTERNESIRWWLKLGIQPLLLLLVGGTLIVGLGVAQRFGWIASVSSATAPLTGPAADSRYICPMMCTPPMSEPGRCPVCGMDLVPMQSHGNGGDKLAVQIDSAARRVAGIRTVAVRAERISREIEAVGQLAYDESSLKTISAYVDGRLEKMFAAYTGVVVQPREQLAVLYSPELYTSQVELLQTRRAFSSQRTASKTSNESRQRLYDSAKRKLTELGMTQLQLVDLEERGAADSRMQITSPIGGTVIEKAVSEGDYVKTGQPIYKVADLSRVWLLLELFPEDAAAISVGEEVRAVVQSWKDREFMGQVAFIDPTVDSMNRTVGVRVVMSNPNGQLRVGDYAKASISVSVGKDVNGQLTESLLVPRSSVLMAGESSVAYVETEPGRFEIRLLTLGPQVGDEIVVLNGVAEGERVASSGTFLIDSQMQIAGNPSLIDPTRATPELIASDFSEMELPPMGEIEIIDSSGATDAGEASTTLSQAELTLIQRQGVCPVAGTKLGSMGTPIKMDIDGRTVFICCEGCRDKLLADPEKHLAKLPAEKTR